MPSNTDLGCIKLDLWQHSSVISLKQQQWVRSSLSELHDTIWQSALCVQPYKSVKWWKCSRCSILHCEISVFQKTWFGCTLCDFELETVSLILWSVHWHILKNIVKLGILCWSQMSWYQFRFYMVLVALWGKHCRWTEQFIVVVNVFAFLVNRFINI